MKNTKRSTQKKVYSPAVSIGMIIIALVLSFVDLSFLNDVIGKILDLDTAPSALIAFMLGLVGMVIMGHLGVKEAYDENQTKATKIGHYLLWIVLGLSFVIVRIMSATIMGLGTGGEDALASAQEVATSTQDAIISTPIGVIRQIDIVVAPLMFFLYLATGILTKDGVKNLISNESFKKWLEDRAESKKRGKDKNDVARTKALIQVQLKKAERHLAAVSQMVTRAMGKATATDNSDRTDLAKKAKKEYDKAQEIVVRISKSSTLEEATSLSNEATSYANRAADLARQSLSINDKSKETPERIAYNAALARYSSYEKQVKEQMSNIAKQLGEIEELDRDIANLDREEQDLIDIVKRSRIGIKYRIAGQINARTNDDVKEMRQLIEKQDSNV